jgi:phage tail-like protein
MSLSVTIDGTNAPITEGETLCLDCTVENTGTDAIEQTVEAGVGNLADGLKKKTLALGPGQSDDVHFEIEAVTYREGNDAEYEKKTWGRPVGAPENGDEVTVSVTKPAHLAVEVQGTNAPVEAGEKIKLTATVENTGGETGHETVALTADVKELADQLVNASRAGTNDKDPNSPPSDIVLDSTGMTLEPGQSEEVTLEWDTGPSSEAVEPGEYALGVAAIPPWERDEWDGPVFGRACTDGSRTDATVVAVQHGPMRTGRFVVEIDDVEVPGWHSVAIPGRSTEQDEYREENGETDWGQTSFDDLEMERGVKPGDTRLYDWHMAVVEGDVEEGRKEIAVVLLDENGETQAEWELQEAWITAYDPPELDAGADGDVATESITVAYDKMDRVEQ